MGFFLPIHEISRSGRGRRKRQQRLSRPGTFLFRFSMIGKKKAHQLFWRRFVSSSGVPVFLSFSLHHANAVFPNVAKACLFVLVDGLFSTNS